MEEKRPYIGRMLSANSRECVMSSLVPQNELPPFGSMLRIPLGTAPDISIYAIVTDITLEDDGFLRQIAGSASISEEVIRDARENRNVPIVLRAAFIGYSEEDRILHLLPPRPPVTLTEIYPCGEQEICDFTRKLGYLRLILNISNMPVGELLAVHLRMASRAHIHNGDAEWAQQAMAELIDLMSGDPQDLLTILGAVGDADIFE